MQKWEGRWEQLVGRIKGILGDLIGDDSYRTEGECERRVGVRKERVGRSLEEFEQHFEERTRP